MTENEQNVEPEQGAEAADQAAPDVPVAADEPDADDPAAAEPAAADPAAAEPAAGERQSDEPAELPSPKERRKRERSLHGGAARPPRSAEERARERSEARRQKASRRRAYRARARELSRARAPREEGPIARKTAGGRRKLRQGVVVSDAADKTITVRIDVARQHRMYGKIVRTSSTLHAHDERNDARVGDMVRVVESRPLSRTKRWRLVEILERAR
jgi:small subunit ribosomal protein S17